MAVPVRNRIGEVYEPFRVRFLERTIETLEPDQVLVKVMASALCGSDLHIARAKHPSAPLPVTIGHEFSGIVAAVGSEVRNVTVGARVTVEPCIVCGKCDACRHGNYSYCENISFTYRNGDGAMADYVVVKSPYVYELPDYLSFETGALIEPLSVATHAVRRAAVGMGDRILIIGDGAIGLFVTAMCRKSGASEIIVAGHSDARLALASELGATEIINTRNTDLLSELRCKTAGQGVEKSFECAGREECFHQAIEALCRNGLATIIGIYEDQDLHFAPARLVTHEIRIQGSQGYCWDFPIAIAAARDIPLEKFISFRFPMPKLQEALNTALSCRNSIKILLTAEEQLDEGDRT